MNRRRPFPAYRRNLLEALRQGLVVLVNGPDFKGPICPDYRQLQMLPGGHLYQSALQALHRAGYVKLSSHANLFLVEVSESGMEKIMGSSYEKRGIAC